MMKLVDIIAGLADRKEAFIFDAEDKYAYVMDEGNHILHLYKVDVVGEATEIDIDYDALAGEIAKAIDLKELIKDRLRVAPPSTLLDINDRLGRVRAPKAKPVKIESRPTCFEVIIAGKRGRPLTWLMLGSDPT